MSSPLVEKVVDDMLAGRGAPDRFAGFTAGPKIYLDLELGGERRLFFTSEKSERNSRRKARKRERR